MPNYHFEIKNVSRGKARSITRSASYITGKKLYDEYEKSTCYSHRQDVLYYGIFQPSPAPPDFYNLQNLCTEIDRAEKRYDARTAREFIGSLPNELPSQELIQIVKEYIECNFVKYGLCAVAAIHEGRNNSDPEKNNPHVHILVSTRTVGADGFNQKKDRERNNRKYVEIWREQWAQVQNRAYERNGYDIRVSHESLEVQGKKDREPTIHLSRIDWQKEKKGEHTSAGDKKRAITEHNRKHAHRHQIELEQKYEIELSR